MLNFTEAVSIIGAVVIVVGFLAEGKLRRHRRTRLLTCVYALGIVWGCLLIFGQPYVRAPIRVGLGVVAVAIMGKVLISMAMRKQNQKA